MPSLKCPQCARELAAGTQTCPWDGTSINSVIARPSLWDDKTITRTQAEVPVRTEQTDEQAVVPALLVGQKLGDYEVGELLGSGGMGEVYAGEQPMIGKKVAIKVLKAEIAAEPGNVQRMLSEARSVNAIRHRSIVDIFNFGTLPDGRPYLVMEYLEGTALDTMLRKQGALVPHDVAEFLEEICSALAAAHGRGIVHRDLKPGNVFIVSDGNSRNRYVKLLDFGLAKGEASSEASRQTRAGMVVGTPDYIAPEQARGGTITPRTDLYSLGVMAFEMVTGALPFAADSVVELMMMHVQTPAPHVSSKIDFCPPALDALIYQLMSKAPEDRPRSAEAVRQELSRIRRMLREGETMVGVTAPSLTVKDTVRIPVPEAATPSALPVPRPSSELATGRRVVDPTARYQVVMPRARSSTRSWLALAGSAALVGAAAWWLLSPPLQRFELIPPPLERRPPEEMRVQPEPAAVITAPVPPDPEEPSTPVKPRPKAPLLRPAAAGPSRETLLAELKRLIAVRGKSFSPKLSKTLEGNFLEKINNAKTPKEREKVLAEMQDVP